MKSLYVALARDIAAEVTKRADRDGNVPRSAGFELQRAIADRVQAMFLGRDRDGKLAPYTLFPGGAVVPLSPYMRQLWDSIKAAIRIPVEQNAVILANKLPADVLYVMARATRNPFVAAGRVAELFRPDPFAVYAAPHEWVDPNGYRLSDRVWNVAAETRRQIDAYVEDSLRRGIGALEMSRGLRQFLTPGEQLRTTTKPYGRTASYSGMRLARTEITRAHNQAHRLAASMNPFVNGLKWNLSARHPRYDICDEYARGGPGGDGVYEVEAYPEIPHPHCVTPGQMVMTERGNVPIEDIEAGDLVLTHMGRYRPVLAAWSTPHDNLVYKFQTRLGKVEVTGNHPVLLRSGWRYAEFVKPGDEILYAGVNIGFDLFVSEANCLPPSFEQGSITHPVTVGLPLMPVDAVALDSNLGFDQGKIKNMASNLVLGMGKDSMPLESLVHNDFDISGAVASENTLLRAKDTAIGLATLDHVLPLTALAGDGNTGGSVHLGNGNLSGNVGALGGVIVSSEIESSTSESHLFTGGNAPTPVVFFPTGGDSVAHASHGDIVGSEQVTQNSIGDAILSKDLSARHAFFGVDFGEQGGDRAAMLIFEPHGVEGGRWDVVSLPMPFEVRQRHPADGASNHYSLLSLSPDKRWGAGSGNPGVRGVITPSLAPLQYSTVLAVSTCQYTGKVYNMEVADDHSYTVNGAAVHNCLCYPSNVMIPAEESASILDQLRADIQATRQEFADLVGPLRVEAFIALLLGEGLEVSSIPGQASFLFSALASQVAA